MLDEASREVKRVKCSLVASSAHSQIIIITINANINSADINKNKASIKPQVITDDFTGCK